MNRRTLWIVLLSVCALAVAGCGGSSHKVTITTAPTTLAAGASSNVVATVAHDSSDQINWTCAPTGACGSFNPATTPNGSPSSYTAPSASGSVTITATSVNHPSRSASVSVSITGVVTANFVFYAAGEENDGEGGGPLYSLAGVVAIAQDGSGTVVSGEQDYNDGDGNTSPQTSGDSITGGSLVMASDGSGNATLTLTTNNTNLPNGGTEVFALAFANTNHAVIVQFDGSATSSGSYDLQTSTAAPVSASFSFAANGTNTDGDPVCDGGVFAIDGSGTITGMYDLNDSDNPPATFGNVIPAEVTTGSVDSFGRGIVSGFLFGGATINYYVDGLEVLRLIAVDPTATAVGSAYGQGSTGAAGSFSSGSIGASVFQIGSARDEYGAVGAFFTEAQVDLAKPKVHANTAVREGEPTVCTGVGLCGFSGEGDLNDLNSGDLFTAAEIDGTYSVAANGYGSLNVADGALGTVVTFGVYAVDPTLNILDPNNTTDTADLGGALIAEMDVNLFGTGSIVPQAAAPALANFSGFYAFGGQGDGGDGGGNFNFAGTATVTTGDGTASFVGEGSISDPLEVLTDSVILSNDATFNATATGPDNFGRYTLGPIAVAPATGDTDFTPFTFQTVTAYQASGGQLYWLEVDEGQYFIGPLEQGTAPSSDARKAQKKSNIRKQ